MSTLNTSPGDAMLNRPMRRTPPRRTVADRLLQNINGIRFELEQMRRSMSESLELFSASDQLLINRSIEKLESESAKLNALLGDESESADPFRIAG
jgi:hypothetical protein